MGVRPEAVVVEGATTSTLTLLSAVAEDSGRYRVLVRNNNGSVASNPATIRVLALPQIIALTPAADGVRLVVSTSLGQQYVVEYQDALSQSGWIQLVAFTASSSVATISDSQAGPTCRFYRVRVE